MKEEMIQLPAIEEIKEMLEIAKKDVQNEVENDPELQSSSQLILNVINIIENKLTQSKNFDLLNETQKIDLAAHLSFLQTLLEDFFMFDAFDEDYEDDELDNEELDYDDLEEDKEK